MAEQATESSLMKKYYYKLNSNKKKGKVGDFTYFKGKVSEIPYIRAEKKHRKNMNSDGERPHQSWAKESMSTFMAT
jgi:hypothetical protein